MNKFIAIVEKMKARNKDAGDEQLNEDERKKFMSSCLSA
jgi:hypothetical protein